MAAGLPVVTTSLVNSGLGARPGEEILLADGVEAMVAQIVVLLQSPELRARIGRAGMEFVRRTHRWEGVVSRMRLVQARLEDARCAAAGPRIECV
jgi:glycosyltransferase involved in cell wall biosynthesis